MKKLKNKFIIGVILLLVIVVISQIYRSYGASQVDTNTYVSLVKGKATLNDGFITVDEPEVLISGDTVRTIGKESLAVVEWGDGSITRLGGNTKISVGNNEVSRDYTRINISFDLIAGKTWSQVVSFISSDSSFSQNFEGIEAGVRGTVFDVDLQEGFVYVSDHKISLKDDGGQLYELGEGIPLNFSNFSFIDITQFFGNIRDTDWTAVNKELDTLRLSALKTEIETHLSSHNPFLFLLEIFSPKYRFLYELDTGKDFTKLRETLQQLSEKQKQHIYQTVLSRYQKLNFVTADDSQYYSDKLLYKRLLILLSDQKDKERLVETTLYDFKDAISLDNVPAFESTMELLNENTQILQNIDTKEILGSVDLLPDDLEQIFLENLSDLGDFFEGGIPDASSLNLETGKQVLDTATETFQDTKQKAEEGIEKGLENIWDNFSN